MKGKFGIKHMLKCIDNPKFYFKVKLGDYQMISLRIIIICVKK